MQAYPLHIADKEALDQTPDGPRRVNLIPVFEHPSCRERGKEARGHCRVAYRLQLCQHMTG
jgi:hypothetical protein